MTSLLIEFSLSIRFAVCSLQMSYTAFVILYMSLTVYGEANRQKVKLTKLALNNLQEPRDIKIRQCKHNVSHFIQIIFYT